MTRLTPTEITHIVTATNGNWNRAQRIQSDIPGVTFLRATVRTNMGTAHVEVYGDERTPGNAAVILGKACHAITPSPEMSTAYVVNA